MCPCARGALLVCGKALSDGRLPGKCDRFWIRAKARQKRAKRYNIGEAPLVGLEREREPCAEHLRGWVGVVGERARLCRCCDGVSSEGSVVSKVRSARAWFAGLVGA